MTTLARIASVVLLMGCGSSAPSHRTSLETEDPAAPEEPRPLPERAVAPPGCSPVEAPPSEDGPSTWAGENESTVAHGCSIYVLSGTPSPGQLSAFDVRTRQWRRLAPSSERAPWATLAAGRGALFALHSTGVVARYDVERDTWTALPSLPSARGLRARSALSLDGDLYAFGGEWATINPPDAPGTVDAGVSKEAWMLPAGAEQWELLPEMPQPRSNAAAVWFQDRIWLVGGLRERLGLRSNDTQAARDAMSFDPVAREWQYEEGVVCTACSATPHRGLLYAFDGGIDARSVGPRVYDPSTQRWERAGRRDPHATGGFIDAVATLDDTIWVLSHPPKRLLTFAPSAETWTVVTPHD